MKTNTQPTDLDRLGRMSFEDVVTLWKRLRREYLAEMKRNERLTNEQIAKRLGMTRQNVGMILAGK